MIWNTYSYTICITLYDTIYTVLITYHTLSWRQKKLKCFTHTTTPDFL